jgi:hypothetical protein
MFGLKKIGFETTAKSMGAWKGVAMDSLTFSPGLALPDPSSPCGRHTHRAGGLRPPSTLLDTPRRMPMAKCDGEQAILVPGSDDGAEAMEIKCRKLNPRHQQMEIGRTQMQDRVQ